MEPSTFSPKSFLKARRPERFSDTTVKEATELDRSRLEFHLFSITSRSQETDFERFARLLCEREICPNLLPHTGPTGGGDSKVDSETYPVADNLALAWYFGSGREAAQERWAFAFSAKSDWLTKLKSDVTKIVETKRGYTKAFFVTNQSVSDRRRANAEDSLRTKHGIDVRILDRTWILDKVFTNRHEELAVGELKVTGLSRRDLIKGPLDTQREEELDAIEKRIQEAIQVGQLGLTLVDDALDAADLARNLERPRVDIEGRYARADQLSLKYGTSRQQIEVAYQWAWTLFWWFEDYSAFAEQFNIVEGRASGSRNAFDLERLFNLWNTLHGSVMRGDLDPKIALYDQHTNTLLAELERLRAEKDRPSTALQAETFLLQVQLAQCWASQKSPDDVLRLLQDVVLRSQGLVGYPLKPLAESLTELGKVFEDITAYNELFETIVEVVSTRDGEISAARLLLTRGEQQFDHDRPVDAIATLGRALGRLYKHETRYLIVKALYYCGCAYENIGLLWAARGTILAAASIATNELWQYGEVTPLQAACYRRLKWIELRLGRVPQILAWQELDTAICQHLAERGHDLEALFSENSTFAALMGRLLLRTDFFDLRAVEKLPDALDNIGLDLSADALLFALGHEQRLKAEAEQLGKDVHEFASKWRSLEAEVPLPETPIFYNQSKVVLTSRVLGCKITIESKIDPPCVEVAESILAAIESFLATGAIYGARAIEPELTVEVQTADFAKDMVGVVVNEHEGRPHLVVRCRRFDPHNIPVDDQQTLRDAIFHVGVKILTNAIVFRDFEHDLETLFRDEQVLDRAVAFTGTSGAQSNVLGTSPKTRLTSWIDEDAKTYSLLRTEPWKPLETTGKDEQNTNSPHFEPGTEPPLGLFDPNLQSHDQIETISLIRGRLWDRAGWTGTAFFTDPDNEQLPIFGFVFRDRAAGREIFTYWRNEFGKIDKQEQIRVVVVKGIDKAHPHAYRVVVGSNPSTFPKGTQFATFVHRVHRMDARTPDNLERFLSAHAALGALYLAPAFAPEGLDEGRLPEVDLDLCIAVHNIQVRNAWEIGVNDIDGVAIHADEDDPIIPDGLENPPIFDLLRKRRAR